MDIAEHSMCQPGKPRAPRRVPLHEVLLVGLPQREVRGVALLLDLVARRSEAPIDRPSELPDRRP